MRPPGAPPVVVCLAGPPGSGKTTLAHALAPILRAAVLDLDAATGPLVDVVLALGGFAGLDDPPMAALTREPRYRTLLELAADSACAGTSSVLVAPFTRELSVQGWAQFADRLTSLAPRAQVRLVWLQLPVAELGRRLRVRGAERDRHKLADPASYLAALTPGVPDAPHLTVDATRPVELTAADLAARLAAGA